MVCHGFSLKKNKLRPQKEHSRQMKVEIQYYAGGATTITAVTAPSLPLLLLSSQLSSQSSVSAASLSPSSSHMETMLEVAEEIRGILHAVMIMERDNHCYIIISLESFT